jgi:hypothetical protein
MFHPILMLCYSWSTARPARIPAPQEDLPHRRTPTVPDLPRKAIHSQQLLRGEESDDRQLPREELGAARLYQDGSDRSFRGRVACKVSPCCRRLKILHWLALASLALVLVLT